MSGLAHAERRGGLVEEHHTTTPADGAPDRDALTLAAGKILNALPDGDRSADPDLVENRAGAGAHRLLSSQPIRPSGPREERISRLR